MFVFNVRKIKKPLLLGVLVLMLGVTTGLLVNQLRAPAEQPVIKLQEQNVKIQELPTVATVPVRENTESDLVTAYRMERQRFLSKNVEALQKLIDDEKQNKEVREQATFRMVNLIERNTQEEKIEFLIQASGVKNCVVMLEGDQMNVLLSEAVTEERAQALKEMVGIAVSFSADDIHLIAPNPPETKP